VAWNPLSSTDERRTYEHLSSQGMPEAECLNEYQRGRDVRHPVAVIENQVKTYVHEDKKCMYIDFIK
jgi:hypothetical protein